MLYFAGTIINRENKKIQPTGEEAAPCSGTGVALILDIDLKLREQPSVADEVSIL